MKVRHMPRHLILTLMKQKRVRGLDVAAKTNPPTSQATVARVIARKDVVRDELREEVWRVLEEELS